MVLLHFSIRVVTSNASLNVLAPKNSYTSEVTHTLQTKRKPDARIVCTRNNLVQKGSMEKAQSHWTDQTAKQVLKYSQFLIEKVHSTLLRCDQYKLGRRYIPQFGHIMLTFKRKVCIKAANLEPQFPVAIFWFSLPLPSVHPKKNNWSHWSHAEGRLWNLSVGRDVMELCHG